MKIGLQKLSASKKNLGKCRRKLTRAKKRLERRDGGHIKKIDEMKKTLKEVDEKIEFLKLKTK